MEELDLVVVGAGWFGLAAAKFHLEFNPSAKVVVFDSAQSVGGVWAKERIYPTLTTNNLVGCYEFWDYPLDPKRYNVTPGRAVPGEVMHEYFADYVDHFNLTNLIRLRTRVEVVEKQEPTGWLLTVKSEEAGEQAQVLAKRLVIATGLTSEPWLPTFEGADQFDTPIVHSKFFKKQASTLTTAKTAVVFGGTKSAWDAAYAYAASGVHVEWVIRKSGHGPAWMSPPFVTPLKQQLEKLVCTRFLTWFSPCIYGQYDGYTWIRSFLNSTWLGRKITNAFFWVLTNDLVTLNKYDSHPETKKLKPWASPFWTGSALSILNYEKDIFDLVRSGKINVHIADIDHLSKGTVHLDSGAALETDVLYCATGWLNTPPMKFLPEGIDRDLGLPINGPLTDTEESQKKKADEELISKFPELLNAPQTKRPIKPLLKSREHTTLGYHMYKLMVPPNAALLRRRDIAFAGYLLTISTTVTAQIQALWITAFFENKLPGLSSTTTEDPEFSEKVGYESMLWARYHALRHPPAGISHGEQYPDIVFEGVPYQDSLMYDLGLRRWRKKGGPWNEWFDAYGKDDYVGLVDEFKKSIKAS